MNEEQIRQKARVYTNKEYMLCTSGEKEAAIKDFIAGAHSRNEEVKELKDELESLRKGFYERGDKLKELMLANNKLRNDNKELEQALAATEDVLDVQREKLEQLRNPWISVEERLPDKYVDFCGRILDFSDKVLVKTKEHPDYWLVAEYYHNDNEWICLENNTYVIRDKVTHWMPIHV